MVRHEKFMMNSIQHRKNHGLSLIVDISDGFNNLGAGARPHVVYTCAHHLICGGPYHTLLKILEPLEWNPNPVT